MKSFVVSTLLILVLSMQAWADEIVLRDGQRFSGKFLRGSASTVEFQILGRTETFSLSNVAQVIFTEREAPVSAGQSVVPAPSPAQPPSSSAPENVSVPPAARRAQIRQDAPPVLETPAKPAATGPSITLPVGSPIVVRTTEAIDTSRNRVGDVFEATLEEAITSDGRTIAHEGTLVKGRIAYSKETGKVTGQSELILELTEMNLDGKTYVLQTSDYQQVGMSTGRRTATAAGGGAALGAIIGAIAGGGKGAAIGAGAGAAVGTGAAVATRGETLNVPAETVLEFRLQSPLTIATPPK